MNDEPLSVALGYANFISL